MVVGKGIVCVWGFWYVGGEGYSMCLGGGLQICWLLYACGGGMVCKGGGGSMEMGEKICIQG